MKLPRTAELVQGFVGIWLFMIISASLLPAIVSEVEAAEPKPAPTIGIFSLWAVLFEIGVVFLILAYVVHRFAPLPQEEDILG